MCFAIYFWHVYLSDTVIFDTSLSDVFSLMLFHEKDNIVSDNRLRMNRWSFKGKLIKSLEKNLALICVLVQCLIYMTFYYYYYLNRNNRSPVPHSESLCLAVEPYQENGENICF